MRLKVNVIALPAIAVLVALLGSSFTEAGMMWYETEMIQPSLNVPKWLFGVAWNTIFLCCTISALILWNSTLKNRDYWIIVCLFASNAILNVLWSYLFFKLHWLEAAFIEMLILEGTSLAIMAFSWRYSKTASLLFLPYLTWVGFASVLTYQIVQLNA